MPRIKLTRAPHLRDFVVELEYEAARAVTPKRGGSEQVVEPLATGAGRAVFVPAVGVAFRSGARSSLRSGLRFPSRKSSGKERNRNASGGGKAELGRK